MTDKPAESAVETHALKTWPAPFSAVRAGRKTAEFRDLRDRDIHVGDVLILNEWLPDERRYTGEYETVVVTDITEGFGIPTGFAMLSFRRSTERIVDKPAESAVERTREAFKGALQYRRDYDCEYPYPAAEAYIGALEKAIAELKADVERLMSWGETWRGRALDYIERNRLNQERADDAEAEVERLKDHRDSETRWACQYKAERDELLEMLRIAATPETTIETLREMYANYDAAHKEEK